MLRGKTKKFTLVFHFPLNQNSTVLPRCILDVNGGVAKF
jgi:hypothetical protein